MNLLIKYLKQHKIQTFKPILISDIDGVLVRGSTPISTTLEALKKVQQNKIPFACLTNGGGQIQQKKAEKLNQIFGLKNYFKGQNMFMNHTPLKPQLVRHSKKGQMILITGSLNIQSILNELQIKNYITCDQFYTLFHQKNKQNNGENNKVQNSFFQRALNYSQTFSRLQKRLGKDMLTNNFQYWISSIHSIFAMNDVSPYQTALQVIHNVLQYKKTKNQEIPAYFAAQNDIIWAGGYHRPRMAFGPFNYILQNHCQKHKFDLKQTYYGKPELKAFKFVEQQMKKKYNSSQQQSQHLFFMVGDNPRADIKGANRAGWGSFLTKTGIHKTDKNDQQNPATVVVQDFAQAVEMLTELIQNEKLFKS